jgi:quercetin dioxygenase-like cupin family protein
MKLNIGILILIAILNCSTKNENMIQTNSNLINRVEGNISALHEKDKLVSTKKIFQGNENTTVSLQISKGGKLAEHITKVEALLICISGEVEFQNEKGLIMPMTVGDYIKIEPMVKHWVVARMDSQLILIK